MCATVYWMIKGALVVALLATVCSNDAWAQDRRLWGTLEPGAHSVGFARSWQLDYARQYAPPYRTDGASPKPENPRPILINLWYPARKTEIAPMRYREYLELGSDNPAIAAFARRLEAFTRRTIAEEMLEERPAKIDQGEAEGIERLFDAITYAVKDAPVAPGRFPLIIGHSGLGGTFEDNSVFYEYLASHGYVVAVAAYQSEDASYLNIDWDLDRSVKEMDFLIRFAKARPGLDLGPIGAIGQSYGAQAVLAWRAENNSPLSAVVSLDSTVEYANPKGPLLRTAQASPRERRAARRADPALCIQRWQAKVRGALAAPEIHTALHGGRAICRTQRLHQSGRDAIRVLAGSHQSAREGSRYPCAVRSRMPVYAEVLRRLPQE